MAAVDLGCWCRQGGDGKLKIAHSAEPGNQQAELLQAFCDEPTRCFSSCRMKCQDKAEQPRQGRRDGAKGRGSPPHCVFWSLPQHVSAAWRASSREKGRLSRPWPMAALCEQQGAVCTTNALFVSVCALPSTAEPALSQWLVGILGRHRPDHKALPPPQSHPWTLPEWSRAQPWKTCFPLHAHELLSPWSCLRYNIPSSPPRGK